MSANSKNKILLIAVAILLLTNIAMLAFFLMGPPKKGGHGGREAMMTEFLQKEMGFNPQQIQQYDTLSKQHREKMKAMFEEVGKNKENQLKQLGAADFSDSSINSIAGQSIEKQKLLEISMFEHLRDVRRICTPDQRPKFDSLVYKVLGRRGEGRKKPEEKK